MFKTKNLSKTLKSIVLFCDNILISGAPGIGKSEIVYNVCEEKGLSLYEVRLYEQGESAIGFPRVDREVTTFTKPFWFARIEKECPDVLLFDDFHLVDSSIQKYFYRFLSSRTIHDFQLPYSPKLIVAGNFNVETASASELQSPVSTRFDIMIHYEPELDTFVEWATKTNRIDKRLIAFIMAEPEALYTPDPPVTTMYPCPRTWEKLSKLIEHTGDASVAPGVIGPKYGSKLIDFWKLLSKEPEEIIEESPKSLKTSEAVCACYILARRVAPEILSGNFSEFSKKAVEWVNQLDADIVVLFCKMCIPNKGRSDKLRRLFIDNLAKLYDKEMKHFDGFKNSLCGKLMRVAVALGGGNAQQEEEILKTSYKNFRRRAFSNVT